MLNKEDILKVDSGQVYKVYEQWPTLAEDSMKIDVSMNNIKPSSLVLAGMGGSGTSADIIYDILYDKVDIPVYVIKGYHLPSFIDSNALAIAISSSGNTEETLSIFAEAHKKGLKIIGISSGGLLEKVCKDNNYMHLKIKETIAPRYSLPSILFAVLNVISNIEGIEWLKDDVYKSIDIMKEISNNISIDTDIKNNIAKQIALYFKSSIPVTYTSPYCRSIGIRFKNSLNENSKSFAITSDIIEASHNEIVVWSKKDNFKPLFIKDVRDGEEIRTRFDIFKDIIGIQHEFYELPLFSKNALAHLIGTLYLLDYATVYLSVLRGIDPLPMEPIILLKEKMKKLNYTSKLGVNV